MMIQYTIKAICFHTYTYLESCEQCPLPLQLIVTPSDPYPLNFFVHLDKAQVIMIVMVNKANCIQPITKKRTIIKKKCMILVRHQKVGDLKQLLFNAYHMSIIL